MTRVPAVILGGTGYVAGELPRLLAVHPYFDLTSPRQQPMTGPLATISRGVAAAALSDHDDPRIRGL
jgi:N-acetyl-gamma-glutamylphosphate reductase